MQPVRLRHVTEIAANATTLEKFLIKIPPK
jgi:hypothetical protein